MNAQASVERFQADCVPIGIALRPHMLVLVCELEDLRDDLDDVGPLTIDQRFSDLEAKVDAISARLAVAEGLVTSSLMGSATLVAPPQVSTQRAIQSGGPPKRPICLPAYKNLHQGQRASLGPLGGESSRADRIQRIRQWS